MEIALTLFVLAPVLCAAFLAWKLFTATRVVEQVGERSVPKPHDWPPTPPRKQYSYWPNPAMQPMPLPPQARVMPTPPRGTVRRECDAPPRPADPDYVTPAAAAAAFYFAVESTPAPAPAPDTGGGDFGGGGASGSWGDSSPSSSDCSSGCISD